jgi:hypothetical protein
VLRSTWSAAALSASTGVTAQHKVDRLEARTAFRAPEPDARAVEPGAQQAAVAAAEPDAQQAAAVAELDAQQGAVLGAQQAVAAASGAQREAVVAPVAVKSRVPPQAASVEVAETAAVRFSIRPVLFSAPALEPALVSVAKEQAAADR